MHAFLTAVEASQPEQRPVVVAKFAKSCFVGLKGIDTPLMDKLGRGQSVGSLKRAGVEPVQAALDALLPAPSLLGVSQAMSAIAKTPGLRLYKREAWRDCIRALETCESGDVEPATDALGRIRDSLSRTKQQIVDRFDEIVRLADDPGRRSRPIDVETLEALEEAVTEFDAAVFVFTPDDQLTIRGVTKPVARDNILFELGLFVGRLGRKRAFVVKPRGENIALPTDLSGITTAEYDPNALDLAAKVGPACNKVRSAIAVALKTGRV